MNVDRVLRCLPRLWIVAFAALLATAVPARANDVLENVRWLLSKPERLPLIVEKRRQEISQFYSSEQGQVLWLDEPRSLELVQSMEAAQREGLRPEDYPPAVLQDAVAALNSTSSPSDIAWVELLYTGHFLDFAHDLRAGRVSPRVLYPDAYMPSNSIDAVDALSRLVSSGGLEAFIDVWQPQDDTYRRLKGHLQHLQSVRQNGGFSYVEPGEPLEAGTSDPRVPILRQRLFEDGLLSKASDDPVFDKRLAFAVGQARLQYGLEISGEISPELIRALNIPIDRRIEQLTNAMERIRWLPNEYARLQLFINKGENSYVFLENGRVVREGEAFPNCPDRNHTTLATTIEAVTFHPTWQVPWEFFGKELLPRLRKDPEQVEAAGYYLKRSGADVPLDALPWKEASLRDIERASNREQYALYLPASIENPLGQYAYRLRQEQRLQLFDLAAAPDEGLFCNPYLPKTAFGIVNGIEILDQIIEPRVLPVDGIADRISRQDTVTFPARGGLMAVVSHQSVWVQRQGLIRFGNDPYLEDARLTAALSGRPKP
ncbi:hypothetical protein [uncultured Roseibium sp.]|uniref:hypothetical protein n=1 Tax=uncultured Roseibium sp. TaxID=1936171 RepID=UPI002637944B|nr:hypothetical protein [uncultured Roseibium sp.]